MRLHSFILITLIASMTFAANALGTKAWTAVEPDGTGTADDPRLIATPENLYWLSLNVATYGAEGLHYVQTADIDMTEYAEWMPIGNKAAGFFADYDGMGHVIKGMSVDWGSPAMVPAPTGGDANATSKKLTDNIAYGLFGWFGGRVKNLVIDHASLYRADTSQANAGNYDLRVGVLAGSVGAATQTSPGPIEIINVVVRNSSITGNGNNPFSVSAYMIGGLIGDMHEYGYEPATVTKPAVAAINISSVYCGVNIDVSNTTLYPDRVWSSKGQQYYAGGMIGRVRSLPVEYMPKHSVYTGTINAPMAMVGPIFACARYNSAAITTLAGCSTGYAGDFIDREKGISTADDFAEAYYHAYKAYNGKTGVESIVEVTEDNTVLNKTYNTRTFRSQSESQTFNSVKAITPYSMSALQGINRGTRIESEDQITGKLVTKGENFKILKVDGQYTLVGAYVITITHTGWDTYCVTVTDSNGNPLNIDYKYRWSVTDEDGTDTEICITDVPELTYGCLIPTGSSLKVTLCDTDDNIMTDEFGQEIAETYPSDFTVNFVLQKKNDTQRGTAYVTYGDGSTVPLGQESAISYEWIIDRPLPAPADDPVTISATQDRTTIAIGKLPFTTGMSVTFTDGYSNTLCSDTLMLGGIDNIWIGINDGKVVPQYTLANSELIPDKDEQSLTYDWQLKYTNNGTPVKTVTYDTPVIDALEPYDVEILLTATDRLGQSRTAKLSYDYDNHTTVLVGKDNTDGKWTFTAEYAYMSGAKLTEATGTYQWYGIPDEISDGIAGYTPLTQGKTLIDDGRYDYDKYCVVYTSKDGTKYYGYAFKHDIVYVYNRADTHTYISTIKAGRQYRDIYDAYDDGDDSNDGMTPATAVKTMQRAYELLDDHKAKEDNIIVIMGYHADDGYLTMQNNLPKDIYNKPATVTGTDNAYIKAIGTLELYGVDGMDGAGTGSRRGIAAPTVISDISLYGSSKELHFYCNLNDFTVGQGVRTENYSTIAANVNGIGDYKAPAITITCGMHNYDNGPLVYHEANVEPGTVTLTIQSGCFGRVIASGRNNTYTTDNGGTTIYNPVSNNCFGHPDNPHRVKVNIMVEHKTNNRLEYSSTSYPYDIGLLVGGQTDGTVYGDARIEMTSGSVGRFIAGNISFGRPVLAGNPADSFFGSTEFTLKDGVVGELFGGTLGRIAIASSPTPTCCAYFYGRSIINLEGGTVNDNIYGAGAGGVLGLGNDTYHTLDATIPYMTDATDAYGRRIVKYASYDNLGGALPKMILHDGTELDLADSYCEVNIKGGTVNGNVYGGGYGHSKQIDVTYALSQGGNVFGNPKVSISGGTVEGNVYGGGEGSDIYYTQAEEDKKDDFKSLANVYGDTNVEITGGVINGSVFAGAKGIGAFPEMAHVYGNTNVTLAGGEVNGNIYGGCDYSSMDGDTYVNVSGGVVGDCIFGGSRGDATDGAESDTHINGDTHVTVSGGDWIATPYINKADNSDGYRTFNIYGGGDQKCIVAGTTHLNITSSLMAHHRSFIPRAENPNSYEKDDYSDFQGPYMDLTYRRFSIYGGGYGRKTNCLNTDVVVNTPTTMVKPDYYTLADFLDHQSWFDIAGGGYSGDIGYWNDDYTEYIGGDCNVLIDGYTYCRKVIGGGFYGSCNNATTHIRCGSLRQVYGGSLLGYVHGKAKLTIGNRVEDDADAKERNKYIYVTENLYGGNDVRGIIGTKLVNVNNGVAVWTTETDTDDKGIDLSIYGGTMMGDIYGAGNGHYRGYYVGEWARYEDGPDEMYRLIKSSLDPSKKTKAYNSRPMVGRVNVDIRGNSDDDYVHMTGNVFGGGRECTIGKWSVTSIGEGSAVDGLRELTDGGHLHVNMGGYTRIDGIMYMGVEGHLYAEQPIIPDGIDLSTFDGTTTNELNKLGDAAYYSWYFNTARNRYEPGFPKPGMTEGNFGMSGETLFNRYVSNIEMKADVELTFYRDILDGAGQRKHWVPAERAFELYDAQGIEMQSFFLGGNCGSMTNANVMHYDYDSASEDFGSIYRVSMPGGVTIKDMLVMGARNATIKYYPYSDDCRSITDHDTPYYTFDGGIGPRDGGQQGRTVSKLTAMCKFDPQIADLGSYGVNDNELHKLYGGIIYGGCYNSGTTSGDVVLNVASNMLGDRIDDAIAESKSDDLDHLPLTEWFGELSSLKHYLGRVYGGGYGGGTRIDGDTYVNLLLDFKGMNVFGGGMKGDVKGASHIVYAGSESGSYVFGSIYGGGLQGSMGYGNGVEQGGTMVYQQAATNLELYSGNVDKVYGGSCLGELYGSVRVKLCDKITTDFTHLDYETFVDFTKSVPDWSASRLIAGHVFGGNDIAGIIHYTAPATAGGRAVDETMPEYYSVYIDVTEEPDTNKKDTPGSANGYCGFPLIGNLYGGSNGDYGEKGERLYTDGEIELATGEIDEDGIMVIETISLAAHSDGDGNAIAAYALPNVNRTCLNITGGTIASAYGGANVSTITDHTRINVSYPDGAADARAGFGSYNDIARFYQLAHLVSREQINEMSQAGTDAAGRRGYLFDNNIYRLFGGNNNADMDIQPDWNLIQGHVGSVYSGGNFGRMTYFDGVNDIGLSLTIDSRKFHAGSVFGGGRIGDIDPAVPSTFATNGTAMEMPDDFYGATLTISDGVIDHVYGGNDVSGVVNYGTHVIINGAISGDVYCAGNGNYRYKYEHDNTALKIEERYDDAYGGRYFVLPQKSGYGSAGLDKIRAINSYRPNVDRTLMTIAGKSATEIAYVRGSVYCGGNSATVLSDVKDGVLSDIKFEIGDNVLLNGVFLGSNGQDLMGMIAVTEALNDLDLTEDSGLTGDDGSLYPHLLDIYMQAVEVCGIPDKFELKDDATNSYIGDFYAGGNRGSMMTDQTIKIDFPKGLVIYGKIVGGSNRANVTYKGTKHIGGLNKKLADGITDKVDLTIRSRFEPWTLDYPQDGDIKAIRRVLDESEAYGRPSFSRYRCNIYGGCFNSGRTVGGIRISLYSDLIGYPETGSELAEAFAAASLDKREMILNGINRTGDDQHRTFSLIGGGYGVDTEVYGAISLSMMPSGDGYHPSAATVFGGSQDGTVVGNTTVMLRDGTVLTNLYGASEATPMYGSSQVLIGWPDYYVCNTPGTYTVKRADELSQTSQQGQLKSTIGLRQGDIISVRVYDAITDVGKSSKFDIVNGADEIAAASATWDDIDIHVGDQGSIYDLNAPYYGQGNVYGGGYISPESTTGTLGNYTVRTFPAPGSAESAELTAKYRYEGYDDSWTGQGGNATILVWDNPANADMTLNVADLRDHISIGTGKYTKISGLKVGDDVVYKFKKATDPYTGETRYIKQSTHKVTAGEQDDFYEFEADGGIYGDGRMVNVEGLRTCDVAYYGYAGSTPQFAKLLNTFQRLDILSITDCCLNLDGAPDILTNGHSNPTKYSLTRIGELQMHSSIAPTDELYAGVQDESQLKNIQHNMPRVRNYMGLGYGVYYLGAMQSSVSFNDPYHYPSGGFTPTADDNETISYDGTPSYRDFKVKRIHQYYQADANGNYKVDPVTNTYAKNPDQKTVFDQRNMGTAANMIGINNGYQLHVKGLDGGDNEYYGPALGVFEVKLLSLTLDEGGGYIYALNNHERAGSANLYHFLETPGNFIFPGAHYSSEEPEKANYIFDDCNPMNIGFDGYASPNEDEEAHYWYVNGSKFYFNVTLSAITDSNGRIFTLDKENSSLYLYRVEPGAGFEVESVNWDPSKNTQSDLQDYHSSTGAGKSYDFYLSVGDKSTEPHDFTTNTADEFVMQVSRANYPSDGNPDLDITYPTGLTYSTGSKTGSVLNDYKRHADGTVNSPLLGITLHDNVDNASREYYDKHLKEPEVVTIGLKATNTEGIDGLTSHYYINLTIHYMLSPIINGNIVIENGALPGEHIFANAFDVDIDKDDNIIIDSYDWWLVPDGVGAYRDSEGKINATDIERDINNGIIVPVSEQSIYSETDDTQLHIPAYRYMDGWGLIYRISVGDSHYYVATSADEDDLNKYPQRPYKPELEVHNYHRMLPLRSAASATPEDLKLTAGSWIYIEDQRDMDYFYSWLNALQASPVRTTETGDDIDPQYGAGLTVFLMADVSMPAGKDYNLRFDGTLHGNGHTIDMGDHKTFLNNDAGKARVYNTGFIAAKSSATIFGNNADAAIVNSYIYYIDKREGTLWLNDGVPTHATEADFKYGRATFDLNGFYLAKRAVGTAYESEGDSGICAVIEGLYADGEYRYATSSADGTDHRALRKYRSDDLTKEDTPNYMSWLDDIRLNMVRDDYGRITGFDSTRHNDFDPADETRYDSDANIHEPIHKTDKLGDEVVKSDYLYFGQCITDDSYATRLTEDIYDTNRVYRVSGFYRSKDDKGYYFNRAAHALDPTLTAIDFHGHPNSSETRIYYPPMPDMPDDLASFDIADGITHNLLIYDTAPGLTPLAAYVYGQTTDADDIRAHIINVGDGGATTPLLHLVDLHDFNAPIVFDVTTRAWYERQPDDYNNADGVWEGISLPFTVGRVMASASGTSVEGDHGWLTHFYGSFAKTDEADSHEYWLRKFTGVESGKAYFARPASEDDTAKNGAYAEHTSSYTYSNTFFSQAYGNEYEHTSEAYTTAGKRYTDYPHITAGYPYIIAYPGERYREFDLSGRFYCAHMKYGYDYAVPQTMTYENDAVTVPVSDTAMTAFTHDGYSYCGTFMHVTPDGNVYVPYDNEMVPETNEILPFRTYMVARSRTDALTIRSRGVDTLDPGDDDGTQPSDDVLDITVEDNVLTVTSSAACQIDLFNTLGQLCRRLDVISGRNQYRDLPSGIYVCRGKKLVIR